MENINRNAYEEAEGAYGEKMDAVYRCGDCTEDHLCINHCFECQDDDYICERQLEEDKLNR